MPILISELTAFISPLAYSRRPAQPATHPIIDQTGKACARLIVRRVVNLHVRKRRNPALDKVDDVRIECAQAG